MATGVSSGFWKSKTHEKNENSVRKIPYPRLEFEGKKSESEIIASPSAMVIQVWPKNDTSSSLNGNRLYFGENLKLLAGLLADSTVRGQVRLIYIDPPYATSMLFQSRDQSDAYKDILVGAPYVEFLRERLILLRELLADDGSIYVHMDYNMAFEIKLVMDEIFGRENFRNWITRKKCNPKNFTRKSYGNISDCILFYSKSSNYVWNRPMDKWTKDWAEREYQCVESNTGRQFKKVPLHAPGVRRGATGTPWRGKNPPPGKHWQYPPATLDEMDRRGEIYWSSTGNPRRKIYLDAKEGVSVQDIWLDFRDAFNQNIHVTGYPTEKNAAMLARIISASSNPGDLVMDCFSGSGTTLVSASKLGRKWIGIDSSRAAIVATLRRFIHGTEPMGDFVNNHSNLNGNGDKKEGKVELTLFNSFETSLITSRRPHLMADQTAIKDFNFICDHSLLSDANDMAMQILKTVKSHDEGMVAERQSLYGSLKKHTEAIVYLKSKDKRLAKLIETIGDCRLAPTKGGFSYLAEAILHQQLSKAAATTIIKRVRQLCGLRRLNPKVLKTISKNQLMTAGISSRKIDYLRDLINKIMIGSVTFEKLPKLSDDDITENLTSVKGIGRWTAEMYLIFVLCRPDVFPIDDNALQSVISNIYHIPRNKNFILKIKSVSDRWRPYRSIASWYLWAYLNSNKENLKLTLRR